MGLSGDSGESIAVLSDIHSNLEALTAVLPLVKGMKIWCLGDMVGYGANPNEVVEELSTRGVIAVMGNHDYAAVAADTGRFNIDAAIAARWTTKELTGKNLEYLRALPPRWALTFENLSTLMVHGSPDDPLWEYVAPSTHSQLFGYYLRKVGAGLIGLGHTHVPYIWKEADGVVFNPGSVGQPRDGDRRASFAVLSIRNSNAEVTIRRVEYDFQKAGDKIRDAGLPERLADRLGSGM